jgi:hypothetical protein
LAIHSFGKAFLLEKVNYLIKFKFSFFVIIYKAFKFHKVILYQKLIKTNTHKMYGYGGISASGLGGLLVGGAKPIRNRGEALRNMLDLENAEKQILHTVNTKKEIEAFRASKFGQIMARDEAQLGRYIGQYNEDTLPIYLERQYLYNQGASRRMPNPHLQGRDDKRTIVAHYALAMKDAKRGDFTKIQQFNTIYPEIGEFYHARTQAPGYMPAPPRKKYDFSHVPKNDNEGDWRRDGKVYNPESKKYVNATGTVGQRLIRRYTLGLGSGLTGY